MRPLLVVALACCSGLPALGCEQGFYFDVPAAADPDAAVTSPGGGPAAPRNACISDDDCPPADLHCDAVKGSCVECVVDEDCAVHGLARCDTERQRCIECRVDRDCPASYRCDGIGQRCMEVCNEEPDCSAGAHGCDERRGVCIACDDDHECGGAALGFCAADGSRCVECRVDGHCAPGSYCDPVQNRCVECRDGRDCMAGICAPATHTCSMQ